MSNVMDTVTKESIRNEMLDMCQMAAPSGANTKILKSALKKAGYDLTEDEVLMQANYLEGKGLAKIEDVGNERLGIKMHIVSITPLGMDYLEGNTENIPGLGG